MRAKRDTDTEGSHQSKCLEKQNVLRKSVNHLKFSHFKKQEHAKFHKKIKIFKMYILHQAD
jgi:hypothetical protein